jgi:phage terminase large subunit GpA-like protein
MDVQEDRFEIEVVGWRQDSGRDPAESWGVASAIHASAGTSTRSKAWTARPIWPQRTGKSTKLGGSNVWTVGVDTAKDAICSKLKVTTPGPGYCDFPIAYQQEFFNQLTSGEVRTRFVRGHPVHYWVQAFR